MSELLPVILLFRHEWLFPSPEQNKILSRPGFEPGLLRPQRSVLTTRRSGPMSKPFFLVILLEFFRCQSCCQLFCCSVMNGCFHHQCKMKFCPEPGFEPGLLRPQRSVLTTRRSGPMSKPFFLVIVLLEFFSLSELLPVVLLFRHELLFPSPVQNKILPRPGFEPGLLQPQRSFLTTRRSGPMSKPSFLVLVLLKSFFVVRVSTLRHERLFPSTVQNNILSRPGFEPGLLRPQRSVLTTRRSGPLSKSPFLALILLESIFIISWYQLFCCAVVKGCFHRHCKMKSCPDQDSNLGYCGHNAVF